METIADPKNGKIYSIFSEAGKNILRNYVNKYKLGGNKIEPYKIFCKNTENGPVCSPNPGALIRGPAGLPRRDMSGPDDRPYYSLDTSTPRSSGRHPNYKLLGSPSHIMTTRLEGDRAPPPPFSPVPPPPPF